MNKCAPVTILATSSGEIPARFCLELWMRSHLTPIALATEGNAAVEARASALAHALALLQTLQRTSGNIALKQLKSRDGENYRQGT